uniref:Translocase of chloroplast n=1 Tax=Rhizophora mucronata TaxID=61149 RepID=A0A2P2LDA2_RHIMU
MVKVLAPSDFNFPNNSISLLCVAEGNCWNPDHSRAKDPIDASLRFWCEARQRRNGRRRNASERRTATLQINT